MAGFEPAIVHPQVDFQVVGAMLQEIVNRIHRVAAAVGDDRRPRAAGDQVQGRGRAGLRHYGVMVLVCALTGWRGETVRSPLAMSSNKSSSRIRKPSSTWAMAPSVTNRLSSAVTVSRLVPMVCASSWWVRPRCTTP